MVIDDDQPAEVAYGHIERPALSESEARREALRWGEDPDNEWREA